MSNLAFLHLLQNWSQPSKMNGTVQDTMTNVGAKFKRVPIYHSRGHSVVFFQSEDGILKRQASNSVLLPHHKPVNVETCRALVQSDAKQCSVRTTITNLWFGTLHKYTLQDKWTKVLGAYPKDLVFFFLFLPFLSNLKTIFKLIS